MLNKDATPTSHFQPVSLPYLILVVTNSNTEWQTVQIQISWLLQIWIYTLQRQGTSGFSMTRVKVLQPGNKILTVGDVKYPRVVFLIHDKMSQKKLFKHSVS